MGIILKYLKKFWPALVICLVLLFGQAMCDLFLPNYMGQIVNVGIQQGGIERSTPEALSEDGYDFLSEFMTAEQKLVTADNYTLVLSGMETAEQLDKYPALSNKNVYVLNTVLTISETELDVMFGQACFTFVLWLQSTEFADFLVFNGFELPETGGSAVLDIAEMYGPMMGLITLYKMQTAGFGQFQAAAGNIDAVMLNTTGASFTKMLYRELGIDVGAIQTNYILLKGLVMLLISLAGGAASILVGFFSSRLAAGFAKKLRADLFTKVQSFGNAEFDKFSTASLITRTTNDITQIQFALVLGVRFLLYAPVLGIGAIIMALSKSIGMGWIVAVALGALLILMAGLLLIALPKFKIMQKLVDKVNLVARENLSGLLVVRAFSTQPREAGRFEDANYNLTKTMRFTQRTMALFMPALMLLMNLLAVVTIWVGAHQVAASSIQVGDMMAFMQYAMLVVMAFIMVAAIFIMIPRALVSSKRIAEVLNTPLSVIDPAEPVSFDNSKTGVVEFKGVGFRYSGAESEVLSDISFVAERGKTTAVVGGTGSGKSTLINLIPRFYDVTAGQVLVNGVDVRKVLQHDLRNSIGYVPQKGMLLSGTVESNLKYGRTDAGNEIVDTALEIAQGAEFVNKLPHKTEAPVAAGGTNFSGGQKQRLSIARALVKEAPIYIFDDSFSALDYKTDAALREALAENAKGSTVIIVAQRVATIRNADQIIVLDKGKLVGKGTHKQLIKNCSVYKEIALSQLNKEEL
ncbi:MAG: ABC transporter ATP-binding protein/permease [Firmicutes bacterium]|nr:ABC transporter ATP-binding protein/permease [Bacillota bacterium]